MVGILSNHHNVYVKHLTILFVNYTSIKMKEKYMDWEKARNYSMRMEMGV